MGTEIIVQKLRDRFKGLQLDIKTISIFTYVKIIVTPEHSIMYTINSRQNTVKIQIMDAVVTYPITESLLDAIIYYTFELAITTHVPSEVMNYLTE